MRIARDDDAPPDAARVAALAVEGRARFAALGAPRFVVQWERALDTPDAVPGVPAGTFRDRTGGGIARFSTPVTRPDARGRGLFGACARTLIAWANAGAPRRAVIVGDPDAASVTLYRRLGFVPVSYLDAVIVPVRDAAHG